MRNLVTLPHNLQAESSLLGALLFKGELYGVVEEFDLAPADFWEIRHQKIFRAIQELYHSGRTPDLVTVSEELTRRGEFDLVGGVDYLRELMDSTQLTSERALSDHAAIVADKSLHRQLIGICEEHASLSYRQESAFDDIVNETTNKLIHLSLRRNSRSVIHIGPAITSEIESLKKRIEEGRVLQGVTSGYPQLDNLTTGFKAGEMVVVAGRPGMGKTSFALNMAVEMAKSGHMVLFFSIEMPTQQLIRRIFSQECLINAKNFTTGRLEQDEIRRLWQQVDVLSALPFYIDESSHLTISDVRSKTKKILVEAGRIDAVFIDYLQLMNDSTYTDDRVREVEHISRNLKLFAKDMGIPVIALAQLSRKAEDRKDGVPMLSDLRDSGAIEQDADVVMFIHRDLSAKEGHDRDLASIMVKKNRNGQIGDIKLRFIPHYTKFSTIDESADEAY